MNSVAFHCPVLLYLKLPVCSLGESVSVIKHTDPVPDPRAVNQDKKNMLFSVSTSLPVLGWELWGTVYLHITICYLIFSAHPPHSIFTELLLFLSLCLL